MIVDEATQSVEAETLILMMQKVPRVVFVGDPEQVTFACVGFAALFSNLIDYFVCWLF